MKSETNSNFYYPNRAQENNMLAWVTTLTICGTFALQVVLGVTALGLLASINTSTHHIVEAVYNNTFYYA